MIGILNAAIMGVRIENAQTQQPKEIVMSQITFRSYAHLHQAGEEFRRTIIGRVRALWRGACRQAERADRVVPYC